MKVAVACDHAGFVYKTKVIDAVCGAGHVVVDLGTDSATVSVDYPDYAEAVGRAIQSGQADRGILLCGSGVGASMTANKMRGIRAGLCHDTYSAHQGVEHDDMNVLTLGARIIGIEMVPELVNAFLGSKYSGDPRHANRLAKVAKLEEKESAKNN
ncbi:MAG: ribose 5-phosphate isomerase B [Nitrospirae bacterium]|nr:ribose 5-phosphate isomerase B [Candidatus Troglogloeales bacterium]MBI3598616.1 ribose 5-phosphate isomerase B [Candidatus Troglogloeales bacterium]